MKSIAAFLAYNTAMIFFLQSAFRGAEAINASPHPILHDELLPPIYIRGDEHFHWEEDENGYTVIDDPGSPGVGGSTTR